MGKWRTYSRRGTSATTGVVEQYVANIKAAGGSIDATGLAAVQGLYGALATSGVWDRLTQVWPCAGTGLASALVQLRYPPGTPVSLTSVSFVGGNYAQTGGAGGLTGDGATKYLIGGPSMRDLGLDCSMMYSVRAGFTGAGNRFLGGVLVSGDQYWVGSLNPAASVAARLGQIVTATLAVPAVAGRWSGVRSSASSLTLYQDAAAVATDATSVTGSTSVQPGYIFCSNSSGSPIGFLAARLTGATWGLSLTAQNVSDLSAAWSAYDVALSR